MKLLETKRITSILIPIGAIREGTRMIREQEGEREPITFSGFHSNSQAQR